VLDPCKPESFCSFFLVVAVWSFQIRILSDPTWLSQFDPFRSGPFPGCCSCILADPASSWSYYLVVADLSLKIFWILPDPTTWLLQIYPWRSGFFLLQLPGSWQKCGRRRQYAWFPLLHNLPAKKRESLKTYRCYQNIKVISCFRCIVTRWSKISWHSPFNIPDLRLKLFSLSYL
jgi:hypothetical protein